MIGRRVKLFGLGRIAHGRTAAGRTGDGALVEFRSVVDAVRCAVEIQNAMVERNAGVGRSR